MNIYETHPKTNIRFKNITIPYWDEVIQIAKRAALTTPTVVTIGWDIAINENGPVIIEGNIGPGHTGLQLPMLTGSRTGNKAVFTPYL